jgi:hypothetical protein
MSPDKKMMYGNNQHSFEINIGSEAYRANHLSVKLPNINLMSGARPTNQQVHLP